MGPRRSPARSPNLKGAGAAQDSKTSSSGSAVGQVQRCGICCKRNFSPVSGTGGTPEPRPPEPRFPPPVHGPSSPLVMRSCSPCLPIGQGGKKLLADIMTRWCILRASSGRGRDIDETWTRPRKVSDAPPRCGLDNWTGWVLRFLGYRRAGLETASGLRCRCDKSVPIRRNRVKSLCVFNP